MEDFTVRMAGPADVDAIARHRCMMFFDMGVLAEHLIPALMEASAAYFSTALATGRYLAWVAELRGSGRVVAGGGMLINEVPPRHHPSGKVLPAGLQGLIVNMYVDPEFRRRGLAARLMREMIAYAKISGLPSLVLHASKAGRPLYEQLGFEPTNEMRLYL